MLSEIDKIIDNFLRITDGIAMSDVIGWFLAAIGGFVVYWIIDNMQTSMERHNMIKDVETSLNVLFSAPLAKSNRMGGKQSFVTVRSVLNDDSPWDRYVREGKKKDLTKTVIKNKQRYVRIRNEKDCEEYISTQAIHELSILFRRLEKLYKDRILRPIDLSDLWREILPMGVSGRLEFYESYLSIFDAEPIAYIVMCAVVACDKVKNEAAVAYFKEYYAEHTELQAIFLNNQRVRLSDWLCKRKFREIMEEEGPIC